MQIEKHTTPNSNGSPVNSLDSFTTARRHLQIVESINLSTSQIVLNWEIKKSSKVKNEVTMSVMGLDSSLSTVRRKASYAPSVNPPSDRVNDVSEVMCDITFHDYQLKTLYHSHKMLPFIKPCTFTLSSKVTWNNWSTKPYIEASFNSEVLCIDVGPEHLFCLMDVYQYVLRKMGKSDPIHTVGTKGGSSKEEEPITAEDGSSDVLLPR